MDLLAQTKGFTLEHLRFLVIDEADRLLDQSFQGWLNTVLHATHSAKQGELCSSFDIFVRHQLVPNSTNTPPRSSVWILG